MGLDLELTIPGANQSLVDELNDWLKHRITPSVIAGTEYNRWYLRDGNAVFDTLWRYYDEGYERGPWPNIRAVLLGAAPVAAEWSLPVYYHNDCRAFTDDDLVTRAFVDAVDNHYLSPDGDAYQRKP